LPGREQPVVIRQPDEEESKWAEWGRVTTARVVVASVMHVVWLKCGRVEIENDE
jgi:hypothetical protein